MPKSTALLTDLGTVITNGPSATTQANAIAAAGPIQDYIGMCYLLKGKFQEAAVLLTQVKGVIDSGDTILTQVNALLAVINGTSNPSTAALTDIATCVNTGPDANSKALAIAAAGPITDIVGCLASVQKALQYALQMLKPGNSAGSLWSITASSDDSSNKTLLANIALTMV